jgi:hypothetical protein
MRTDTSINSVRSFGEIDNVEIISDKTVIETGKRKILLCPFGHDITVDSVDYDIAFGHFEFAGAKLAGGLSKGKIQRSDIHKISPLVFSGHYHIRREYTSNNRCIITGGSLLPLDRGDIGNTKGVYVINTDSLSYDFIENKISPCFTKVIWSKLKNKTATISKDDIKGNYVDLIVDDEYTFEQINKIKQVMDSLNPRVPIKIDYVYNVFGLTKNELGAIETSRQSDPLLILKEYIYQLSDDDLNSLDRDKLFTLAKSYYDIALEGK